MLPYALPDLPLWSVLCGLSLTPLWSVLCGLSLTPLWSVLCGLSLTPLWSVLCGLSLTPCLSPAIAAHVSASVSLLFFLFEQWSCTLYWWIFVFCSSNASLI
ncbi:UNVERIFIED_CONTAM: hypothetical protein FKN15_052650 [Acipenser sinensis]